MQPPSERYVQQVCLSLRLSTDDFNDEIRDLIQECRSDLVRLGILPLYALDEKDPLILAAVKLYAGWKFNRDNDLANRYKEDYTELKDELRKRVKYRGGAADVDEG